MTRTLLVLMAALMLVAGSARTTDDSAPAGYSSLRRALEQKFAETKARDQETHVDDGYGWN